jgi:GR25 family glycosyltransferase involved in LPS biosynthesis
MRVYIITSMENNHSKAMAQLTLDSAIYNSGYQPEIFSAYDGNTGAQLLTNNNIKLRQGYPAHRPGAIGRIASHIALWNICVQANEPIIVAEHDALLLRDWDNPIFADVLHLNCYGSYVRAHAWAKAAVNDRYAPIQENSVYRMGFEPFDFPGRVSMSTTFGYAIKPHAAQSLIQSAFRDGYCFTDRFMAEPLISIATVHPPIAHEQLTSDMSAAR